MLRTMQVTFLPGLVPTGDSGLWDISVDWNANS
jgi:hypothetical protein